MGNDILQNLTGIHNLLYEIPVSGPSVVPMAQALVTLQKLIRDIAIQEQETKSKESEVQE